MSHPYEQAVVGILDWFHKAETDLVGAAIVTFNGEAGTIHELKLDEHHGLCFTVDELDDDIKDRRRFYPVSTIRMKT